MKDIEYTIICVINYTFISWPKTRWCHYPGLYCTQDHWRPLAPHATKRLGLLKLKVPATRSELKRWNHLQLLQMLEMKMVDHRIKMQL